jgi:hypothetical protein
VKTVRVYRRLGKGKWTRIGATSAATLKVKLRKGSSYAFYSVGVDNAGNREAVPANPDARTRVS